MVKASILIRISHTWKELKEREVYCVLGKISRCRPDDLIFHIPCESFRMHNYLLFPFPSKVIKYVNAGMRHVRDGKLLVFPEIIVVLLKFFFIFKSIFFIKNSKS